MKFHNQTSEIYIPDNLPETSALSRSTHLAISAHQDDIEIMAASPILECFQQTDKWFSAVVVTDGRGSPRNGIYEKYSDDEMRLVRIKEQKKAAFVGEYASLTMLDYPSAQVKDARFPFVVQDLASVIRATQPDVIYTHNLADKHDTHIAVVLRVIQAIRALEKSERPEKLFGCEVWRNLDWMLDSSKVPFDLSAMENLQAALVGVFDSQISGGKKYDQASLARRRANATYFESHGVDVYTGLSFGMDLTPLISDDKLDPAGFISNLINQFQQDVNDRLSRLSEIGRKEGNTKE